MKPVIRYTRQLLPVERPSPCDLVSQEAATQKTREADKFSYYVPGGQQTPWNPLKEIDELYCKDSKVPLIDLEVFAREHIKSVEEQRFNREM